jgi:hypothetical protein
MSRRSKYTIAISKYDLPNRKKSTLSKFFRIPRTLLDDAFDRGIGAFRNNPSSIRKSVSSEDQWATARTYKMIVNTLLARQGKKVPTGRGQDYDLVEQAVEFSDFVPKTTSQK